LSFVIKGKTHYGWARVSSGITRNGRTLRAVLTGYAYETVPGKAIITGKTKGPVEIGSSTSVSNPTPEPQPVTLGVLALGAH
jgi:hypothetical protein